MIFFEKHKRIGKSTTKNSQDIVLISSDVIAALVEQQNECTARGEKHEAFGCQLCIRKIKQLQAYRGGADHAG